MKAQNRTKHAMIGMNIRRFVIFILVVALSNLSLPVSYGANDTSEFKAPDNLIIVQKDSKHLKLKWDKVEGAKGYEIYKMYHCLGGYRRVKKIKKTSWTTKVGIRRIGTYKVRAYKSVNGEKVYSPFSYIVSAKTCNKKEKKANATKVRIWGSIIREHEYGLCEKGGDRDMHKTVYPSAKEGSKKAALRQKVQWFSTDTSIATIDENGIIQAQDNVGECYIYARAHNGIKSNLYKVKVMDYAYEAVNIQYAPGQIQVLFNMFEKDIRDICSYYAKHRPQKEWWISYGSDYKMSENAPTDEMTETVKKVVRESPFFTYVEVGDGWIEIEVETIAAIAYFCYIPDKIVNMPFYDELSEHWLYYERLKV
ncbi:MAG: hypothetical protein IKE52_06170 [Mogibacterium sp.]|nr:hypothetical protein [Mogibacterium sp.]